MTWPKQNSLTRAMHKCSEKLGSLVSSLTVAEFKERLDKCPWKNTEVGSFGEAVFFTLFWDNLEPLRGRMYRKRVEAQDKTGSHYRDY